MRLISRWLIAAIIVIGLSSCESFMQFYFWPLSVENQENQKDESIPG